MSEQSPPYGDPPAPSTRISEAELCHVSHEDLIAEIRRYRALLDRMYGITYPWISDPKNTPEQLRAEIEAEVRAIRTEREMSARVTETRAAHQHDWYDVSAFGSEYHEERCVARGGCGLERRVLWSVLLPYYPHKDSRMLELPESVWQYTTERDATSSSR